MRYGTKVVTRTGEFSLESDTYEFEDGILYAYDADGDVMLAIPQENVEYVVPCEFEDADDEPESEEPADEPQPATPDPGPGYRLIDKAVDTPQEGDEYWDGLTWCHRVGTSFFGLKYTTMDHYRRRVTPEPVCKREAFSGCGSPSPRECGVCGEGPCPKKAVEEWPKYYQYRDGLFEDRMSPYYIRRLSKAKMEFAYIDGSVKPAVSDWSRYDDEHVDNGKWIEVDRATAEAAIQKPQPVESPDDWVTQDRVPVRVGVDEFRYNSWPAGRWKPATPQERFAAVSHGRRHEWDGAVLELRCRRQDLPPLPTTPSVGDTVIVQMDGNEWNGCKRTVIAKLPDDYFVVSKTGEPLSRVYVSKNLRVVPKREESTIG